MSEILASQARPAGPALAIITNAGGPGVMATDALMLEGGQLAAQEGLVRIGRLAEQQLAADREQLGSNHRRRVYG